MCLVVSFLLKLQPQPPVQFQINMYHANTLITIELSIIELNGSELSRSVHSYGDVNTCKWIQSGVKEAEEVMRGV